MTQDEIIEMADKAGIESNQYMIYEALAHTAFVCSIQELEAFAKLVAAHTLMNIDPSKFMSYHERKEVGDVNPV